MKVRYEFDIGEKECTYNKEEDGEYYYCHFFSFINHSCTLFNTELSRSSSSDGGQARCWECLDRFPAPKGEAQ